MNKNEYFTVKINITHEDIKDEIISYLDGASFINNPDILFITNTVYILQKYGCLNERGCKVAKLIFEDGRQNE